MVSVFFAKAPPTICSAAANVFGGPRATADHAAGGGLAARRPGGRGRLWHGAVDPAPSGDDAGGRYRGRFGGAHARCGAAQRHRRPHRVDSGQRLPPAAGRRGRRAGGDGYGGSSAAPAGARLYGGAAHPATRWTAEPLDVHPSARRGVLSESLLSEHRRDRPAAVSFGGGAERRAATGRLRGRAGPGDGRAPPTGYRRRRRPCARPLYLDPGHAPTARVPVGVAAPRGDAGPGPLDPAGAALRMGDHHRPENKIGARGLLWCSLGCGGEIRTRDLRVMSPTSFHCSTPRAASDRGESVILGALLWLRQARVGAVTGGRSRLLEPASPLRLQVALDVEQALLAALEKLREFLL